MCFFFRKFGKGSSRTSTRKHWRWTSLKKRWWCSRWARRWPSRTKISPKILKFYFLAHRLHHHSFLNPIGGENNAGAAGGRGGDLPEPKPNRDSKIKNCFISYVKYKILYLRTICSVLKMSFFCLVCGTRRGRRSTTRLQEGKKKRHFKTRVQVATKFYMHVHVRF